MDDANRSKRESVWTRHWDTGVTHSCGRSYATRYGGALADFWRPVFGRCSSSDRVLDIATGNGALPRLAVALHPDRHYCVDAVDIASIRPDWLADLPLTQRSRIQLHAGVSSERLPFEAGCFDLVVSQYGIEYSEMALSLPEVQRVLSAAGRLAFLAHHHASRPVTLAAIEIAHLDWLLGESGLLAAAEPMFSLIAQASTAASRERLANDPRAEAARERFNAAQDALRARGSGDGADVLFEAQDAIAAMLELAARAGAALAHERFTQVWSALDDARWRLLELRAAALTPQALQALAAQLATRCEVTVGEVSDQGFLMGWSIQSGPPIR